MKVYINETDQTEDILVEIRCNKITEKVNRLKSFIASFEDRIPGKKDGENVNLDVREVLYIESVDNRVFLYTEKEVFETEFRLYELEERLDAGDFFRCNKSMIVNVNHIRKLRPEMTRNIRATLSNGETVDISRRYVKKFKEMILGKESR